MGKRVMEVREIRGFEGCEEGRLKVEEQRVKMV